MEDRSGQQTPPKTPAPGMPEAEPPFGVHEVRLDVRHWSATLALVALIGLATPALWKRIEQFPTGPDYRIPYQLSKDYWLYERRTRQSGNPAGIIVLGDSVVWGEYVLPDGTWSHFLSQEAGKPDRFINAGVNGLFPLALEGLVDDYAGGWHGRKILLHCNLLWMSSPQADLQVQKEENFNHSRLVPQFWPRVPCYRADANERLSAVVARNVPFVAWVNHLQTAYFGGRSILSWTLQDDGHEPPRYPNAYRNPFALVTLTIPSAPPDDPQRGPGSPRHRPWSANGGARSQFEWVKLDGSLQWSAFKRLVNTLRTRGNDVLVVLGPFNEHMVKEETLGAYRELRNGVAAWLAQESIPCVAPEVLPSELYADASHPLTEGYALLARQLCANPTFARWLRK